KVCNKLITLAKLFSIFGTKKAKTEYITFNMGKKLLLLASSFLCVLTASRTAHAQVDYALFKLPDTVCADHEIVPFDVIEGAQNYSWTICPPDLYSAPEGFSMPGQANVHNTQGFITAEDEDANFTFHLNGNGD